MNRRCRVAASIALATVELGAASTCSREPAPATIAHHGDRSPYQDTENDTVAVQGWVVDDDVRAPAPTTTVAPAAPPTTEPPPALDLPEPEPVVTTRVTTPVTTRRTTTTVYEPPSPQSRTTGRGNEPPGNDAPLACIRSYEGGYTTNTGNGYYGAYQFDLPTWRSVGGTGLPSDASPAEQDMRAQMLYDRRGLAPWPTPAVMCR